MRLSPSEARVLKLFVTNDIVSYDTIYGELWPDSRPKKPATHVYLHRVRNYLHHVLGISMKMKRGKGWWITRKEAEKVMKALPNIDARY